MIVGKNFIPKFIPTFFRPVKNSINQAVLPEKRVFWAISCGQNNTLGGGCYIHLTTEAYFILNIFPPTPGGYLPKPLKGNQQGSRKSQRKRDFWEEERQAQRARRQAKRADCQGALPATRQSVAVCDRSREPTTAPKVRELYYPLNYGSIQVGI